MPRYRDALSRPARSAREVSRSVGGATGAAAGAARGRVPRARARHRGARARAPAAAARLRAGGAPRPPAAPLHRHHIQRSPALALYALSIFFYTVHTICY